MGFNFLGSEEVNAHEPGVAFHRKIKLIVGHQVLFLWICMSCNGAQKENVTVTGYNYVMSQNFFFSI